MATSFQSNECRTLFGVKPVQLVTVVGLVCLQPACGARSEARHGVDADAAGVVDAAPAVLDGGSDADASDPPDADVVDAADDNGARCRVSVEPNAEVSITSPRGAFTGGVGLFTIVEGECGYTITVAIAEDVATLGEHPPSGPDPRYMGNVLLIRPDNWDPTTRSWIGTGPARVTHWLGGESVGIEGTVTIEEFVRPYLMAPPAPRLRAQVRVDAPGWTGGGSFDVSHCRGRDIFCP